MYDFPSSPAENQEYTPPVGGQVYIYKAPRWLVKGAPPAGGAPPSGIDEAPVNGQQYARKNGGWAIVSGGAVAWVDITGKPASFPPNLPIPSAGVTGLDTKQSQQDTLIAGKLNASVYTAADVLDKVKTVDGEGSGLDADTVDGHDSFHLMDRANHSGTQAQATIVNLIGDLAAKAPLASPALTGTPTAVTAATPTNTTQIATTAFVQANVTPVVAAVATKEPTIAGGTTAQYWRGDKSWQTLPPPGIYDAPADGKQYARVNNAWVEVFIPPPAVTPFQVDSNGDAIIKFGASIVIRIKSTGLILTKDDIEVFSVSV